MNFAETMLKDTQHFVREKYKTAHDYAEEVVKPSYWNERRWAMQ